MKVFISWSGDRSEHVACVLRTWLPLMIQEIEPFVSSEDIEKGGLWFSEVASQLNDSDAGIVCLTPENQGKPWVLFESGALAREFGKTHVCTYLFGLRKSDVTGPLAQFQHTAAEEGDTQRMVESLNKLAERPLDAKQVEKAFLAFWPHIDAELEKAPPAEPNTSKPRDPNDMIGEILAGVRYLRRQSEPTDPAKRQMQQTVVFTSDKAVAEEFRLALPSIDNVQSASEVKTEDGLSKVVISFTHPLGPARRANIHRKIRELAERLGIILR